MSTGPVFILLTNTSIGDKLLYASDYLRKKISSIIEAKRHNDINVTDRDRLTLPRKGSFYSDVYSAYLPSLNEIEKTHTTFLNASYKPNVLTASEYIKVRHPNAKFGSTITFQFPQVGQFSHDTVLHIRLSGMSSIDYRDKIRYAAMLGHKLVTHVQFLINEGAVLDEYTSTDYNTYYQYEVPPNHKNGYLRNIGQEIPSVGYVTPDPSTDMFREYKLIGDGNQTLKHSHDGIDLYIPILHWFSKHQRNALPALPWGQLQIKVTLANLSEIIGIYDGGGGGAYNPPTIAPIEVPAI
jgi:hypothetical protein